MCSVAARGLWMDVLAMAHGGVPAGHLTVNGKPASTKQIAAISRCPEKDVAKLLAELEDAGVFSRTDAGVIFNRRMVRDAIASEEGAINVAKRRDRTPDHKPPTNGARKDPYKGGSYSIDQNHKSESESPSDAGARDTAPREGVFYLNEKKQEEEPEPTVQEIKANRDRQLQALDASPVAGVVKSLAGELRHFAPALGKKPERDVHGQIDEVGPRRQVKAFHLTPEQLAIARKAGTK